MQFDYIAKNTDGLSSSGLLTAESSSDARLRLRERGLFALSIAPTSTTKTSTSARRGMIRRSHIGKSDVLLLTNQLAMMSDAGVDLGESLQIVAEQCPNESLRVVLTQIHEDVSAGVAVSDALRKHSTIFGEAYVASSSAGEASGTLTDVLSRLAELLRHEMRLLNAIRSVMAYPVVLIGVAFVVMSVLVFFILPQFETVFTSLGKDPPWHTKCLLDGAGLVRVYFPLIGLAVSAVLAGVLKFGGTERAARHWDGIIVNLRFIKPATRSLLTGRTFRLLGTMLQSGIPLLEGIRLCRASVRNRLYRRLFDQMEESVVNGGSIADVLVVCPLLPGGAAQMIQTAERTGRLAPVMVSMGSFYEEEGEQKVRDLVKRLEPLIIIALGVVVCGVVMAIMLPLLEISTSSR